MQVQISWLLQKPTDLDLHCLQRQGISEFSRTRTESTNHNCSRQHPDFFYFLRVNKTWLFMWNVWFTWNVKSYFLRRLQKIENVVRCKFASCFNSQRHSVICPKITFPHIQCTFNFSDQTVKIQINMSKRSRLISVCCHSINRFANKHQIKSSKFSNHLIAGEGLVALLCLCLWLYWGFTAQSTKWGHVQRGQFA